MKERLDMDGLSREFLAMEVELGLFARRIGDVHYWRMVRFSLLNNILMPLLIPVSDPHPDMRMAKRHGIRRALGKVSAAFAGVRDRLMHNPEVFGGKTPLLFALEPRQATLPDGRRVSLMLDFLLPRLSNAYAVLQFPSGGVYGVKGANHRVFRLDAAETEERRSFARGLTEADARAVAAEAALLSGVIRERWNVSVAGNAIGSFIGKILLIHRARLEVFRRWLTKLEVKCVVTSVHYDISNLILAEAAHGMGVQVAELQHGTVFKAHAAYNLPVRDDLMSPDWFCAWGPYWTTQMSNYAVRGNKLMGYPYFDYFKERYPRIPHPGRSCVVVVSQGTIGMELSRFAVELAELLPQDGFEVVFKLHPSESRTWRNLYPWLEGSRVEVISNVQKNIYACFAEADFVVGVYSTSIVEAVAWGLKAFVVRGLPGWDTMKPFVDRGYVETVDTAKELSGRIAVGEARGRSVAVEELWMPDSSRRLAAFLDGLAEGKCQEGEVP